MGKICCKNEDLSSDEDYYEGNYPIVSDMIKYKDLLLPPYKSKGDKFYEKLEIKYNLLNKLKFSDFLLSLANFAPKNMTLKDSYSKKYEFSMNDQFFEEDFCQEYFQIFLENKIFKHEKLYKFSGKNEIISNNIFKRGLLIMHKGLAKKLFQNENQNENAEVNENNIIKKRDIICFGLLYCGDSKKKKVKLLFNLFKENDVIQTNEKFSKFLLSLFLLASYCTLHARVILPKHNKEIGIIKNVDFQELIDCAQLKDCQNLVKVTNQLIFGEDLSKRLSFGEFKGLFTLNKNKSLGFLLSPSGIRYMLQENNV